MHSDRFFFSDLAIRYKYLSRVCRFGPAFLPFFANLFLGLLVILAANILSALLPTGARKKRAIRRKSKQARKSNLHFLSTLILAIRKRKGKTKPYAFFSISEREEGPATKPYKSPFPLRATVTIGDKMTFRLRKSVYKMNSWLRGQKAPLVWVVLLGNLISGQV